MRPEDREIYGVFWWKPDGRYPEHDAIRTYSRKGNAEAWADEENRKDGGNRVVRTIPLPARFESDYDQ